jgi:hypothetical protein
MRMRALVAIVIIFTVAAAFAQEAPKAKQEKVITNIPVQAQYSNKFKIKEYYFNRKVDVNGRGEILEVELLFENLTDDQLDLYIFTIATTEKVEKTKSSFEKPIPEKERIRNFVPYPDDLKNFEYEKAGKAGETAFLKFPKNPKAGINPLTGQPYHLKDKLMVRTYHLCSYKVNYSFFNNITILVFDSEGKPAFRKLYDFQGYRR